MKSAPQYNTPQRRIPALLILCSLAISLCLLTLVAISLGSTTIDMRTIAQILLNGTGIFHFARQWDSSYEVIIWQVRMPGVVSAVLVGMALAVAGVLFQGLLRNPLADPYLIGTSSGAALGTAIAFVLPFETMYGGYFPLTTLLAFIGALGTVLFVYAIARIDGHTPVVTLLLAGVVVNAVLVAVQTLILTLAPHAQFQLQALFNWLSGGVAVTNWFPVLVVGIIVTIGLGCAFGFAHVLDVFGLGEEGAAHLGVQVERYKFVIVIVASLLTAAAVSISGLIGFVGLVVPHVMRLWLGPDHRLLVAGCYCSGGLACWRFYCSGRSTLFLILIA
ncbi:MAG: iron ABC transporter permease [Chloroflexi bacterium]|nr:MAG: iron ABC transporter permease [Chloroflexota bacterium]